MRGMIQLNIVTLQRGTRFILDGADLTVHAGHRIGLVGRNGAGKTSLLKLLAREFQPDGGDYLAPADWRIAAMDQEPEATGQPALEFVIDGDAALRALQAEIADCEAQSRHERLAGLYEKLENLGGYTAEARAGELLHGLGFRGDELRRPVSSFSGGWRIRLSLAQALMCPSDLLLLDEPTNHLDLDATYWLEDWLRRYPGTLVLISHDRDFLDAVVNHIVHIEEGKLNLYRGHYTAFEEQRAARLVQQASLYAKQQRRISEIESFVSRFKAKATKARQAQSRMKELERMERLAPAHIDSPFAFEFRHANKMSDPLIHLSQGRAGYGDKTVLEKLEFALHPGSRVGLLGPNGAGKSTLIKTLVGDLPLQAGVRTLGENTRIGYFAQHQVDALDLEASPLLHLQRMDPKMSEQQLRDFIGGFDFRGDDALRPVKTCSGGEKARLALALLVWAAPNVLLLDEPTNHLDLEMRQALAEALQGFDGAVVVVSHDRFLLRSTVDDFWLVAEGRAQPFDGDLEDYHRWLADHTRQTAASSADSGGDKTDRKAERRAAAEIRQQLAPLKKQVQAVEKKMATANEKLKKIEDKLADNGLYEAARKDELQKLLLEQGEQKSAVNALEEEWFMLSGELEELEQSLAG